MNPMTTEIPVLPRSDTVGEFAEVTAAILAGGLGTRLRSAVSGCPKGLARVGKRPFLAYLFDQLLAAGTRDVVVCTGYLGDQIPRLFGESYGTLRLSYSRELGSLGTAGALRLALPLLKSNPVLVMNGDSYCDVNLREFWIWHGKRRAEATLLLATISDPERFGQVQIDGDGKVIAFKEKDGFVGSGRINAGIYLLSQNLLAEIPVNRAVSLEREIFPHWVGRGLYGFHSETRFIDIGTPESYARAERFFASLAK
jgi:NDP-sugar pyrophosphorylase family protein